MLTFCEFGNRNYVLFDVGSIFRMNAPYSRSASFVTLYSNGHISGYQKIRLFFANCLFLGSAVQGATQNKPVEHLICNHFSRKVVLQTRSTTLLEPEKKVDL